MMITAVSLPQYSFPDRLERLIQAKSPCTYLLLLSNRAIMHALPRIGRV